MQKYVRKTKPYRYQQKDDQDRTQEIKPPTREIKTISGGITIGGTLKSLKKAQGREINSIQIGRASCRERV